MFCKQYRLKIKALMGQFDKLVEENIETAIKVTTSLKQFLKGGYADILTAIIPGEVDDMIRAKLIMGLEKALDALQIVNACKDAVGVEAKIRCFVDEISRRDPALQDALLQKIASMLASELDGKRLAQSLYDLYTQAKYTAGK